MNRALVRGPEFAPDPTLRLVRQLPVNRTVIYTLEFSCRKREHVVIEQSSAVQLQYPGCRPGIRVSPSRDFPDVIAVVVQAHVVRCPVIDFDCATTAGFAPSTGCLGGRWWSFLAFHIDVRVFLYIGIFASPAALLALSSFVVVVCSPFGTRGTLRHASPRENQCDNHDKNGNTEPAKHKSDSFHTLPPSTRHGGEFLLVFILQMAHVLAPCFYFFGRISLPSHSRRRGSPVKQGYDFGALRTAMRSSDQVAGVTGAAPRLPTVERSCSRGLVKPRFAVFSP